MPADSYDPKVTLAEKLTDFAMALTEDELPLFLDLIDAGGDVHGFDAIQDAARMMEMISQMLRQMNDANSQIIRNIRA